MVLDNQIALDYQLADQGGVCALASRSSCFHVNASGLIEESAHRLLGKATWQTGQAASSGPTNMQQVKQALPSVTWFLPFLGPLIITFVLLLIFEPCILNCLVFFVSKRLESIKLPMVVAQGHEQSGLRPGDNLKAAEEKFCFSPEVMMTPKLSRKQLQKMDLFAPQRPSRKRSRTEDRGGICHQQSP